MSQVEKNIADTASNDDAPKKVYKRNFVFIFTKARQEAFERCRKARQESLKKVDKSREIKRVLKREEKVKKKKEELGLDEAKPEPVIHFPESNPVPSSDEEDELPPPPPKKPRKSKRKAKVIIQKDSSSEDDEEFEYVIKRVVSKKPPKADKYIPPPNQKNPIFTKFNSPTSYFL